MKKTLTLLIIYFVAYQQSNTLAQNKPNILWIMTDDQRMDSNGIYNLTVSGKNESPLGHVESPNIDKLASEGVFFSNAYCNSPACVPSRGSMITGKYNHHAGFYGFERTHDQVDFFTPTLPQEMESQGYATSMFGKGGYYIFEWGPGLTWEDTGFYNSQVEFKGDLRNHGFTDYYHRALWEGGSFKGRRREFYYPDGRELFYFTDREGTELTADDLANKARAEDEFDLLYSYTRDLSDLIIGGVSPQTKERTIDGRILQEYKAYLKNQNRSYQTLAGKTTSGAKSSQPQFVSLSFSFPHTPVLPPKEFRDKFKDKVYQVPEFDQSELDKLPPQMVGLYNSLKIDGLKPEEKQQAIQDYYAFCAYGDWLVGEAVDAFKAYSKKNGQEYLILYVTGDHGWHLGEQGIEAKFTPWELSNHGAAIVVASDKSKYPAGEVYRGFTEYVDFMPTMLAAAGADTKKPQFDHLDGYDWAEMLKKDGPSKEYIIGEINHVAGPRAYMRSEDFSFSMRSRKKFGKPGGSYQPNEDILWGLEAPRNDVQMALYDLRIDPKERNNVANDSDYIELADWFRNKLGNIIFGDGRIEVVWSEPNTYSVSDFAIGADDKKLNIPTTIIPTVEDVDIEEVSVELVVGETYQLTFQSNSEEKITWSSNNPDIFSVNESGLVTCKAEGTAGVSARIDGAGDDICVFKTPIDLPTPILSLEEDNTYGSPFPVPSTSIFDISKVGFEWQELIIEDFSGRRIQTIESSKEPAEIGGTWKKGAYILRFISKNKQHIFRVIKE